MPGQPPLITEGSVGRKFIWVPVQAAVPWNQPGFVSSPCKTSLAAQHSSPQDSVPILSSREEGGIWGCLALSRWVGRFCSGVCSRNSNCSFSSLESCAAKEWCRDSLDWLEVLKCSRMGNCFQGRTSDHFLMKYFKCRVANSCFSIPEEIWAKEKCRNKCNARSYERKT